jgi:hypothetical protein
LAIPPDHWRKLNHYHAGVNGFLEAPARSRDSFSDILANFALSSWLYPKSTAVQLQPIFLLLGQHFRTG